MSAGSLMAAPTLLFTDEIQSAMPVEILNPLNRVPVSFIIDDSTALVNMAHYGIPQFAGTFPDNYRQDWRKLPREIPDAFVLEFIEWCPGHGVKGKYSMVPYPACTGWLHRFIPGWTAAELGDSLRIVRDIVSKDWDIHPEMISHTRVIDIRTGLPFPQSTPGFMENWEWSQDKSADELGAYMAYALNVLKEAGLHCDGVTTPGGFCHRNKQNLAIGTHDAVRDVYGGRIAHFFRDVVTDPEESVAPQIMHVAGLGTSDPSCSVHIIGCTDDWFGGWDGLVPGNADKFITEDLSSGRMVEVIDSGEPAIMVCHWPGIYYNGDRIGFNVFKEVVRRIERKYPDVLWMKLSEIARYWAAKELTKIETAAEGVQLEAPFAAQCFTIKIPGKMTAPVLTNRGSAVPLQKVMDPKDLRPGVWLAEAQDIVCCFDLPAGSSTLKLKK